MDYFVAPDSIVRKIWGKADVILFIFAGSAAEFALNKAVDWLYFTGKLPADPLGRLFTTVEYAKQIVFAEKEAALKTIEKINTIHAALEKSRGYSIPDWAYRDVLFMLIDYSIRSLEILDRPLTKKEKEDVFEVFSRMGTLMHLKNLPASFEEWLPVRQQHLQCDLSSSHFTTDLYKQYRKHLGWIRYCLLIEVQKMLVPSSVWNLLQLKKPVLLKPVLPVYRLSRRVSFDWVFKQLILPPKYIKQIQALDRV